jgi:hypothetical protein
MKRFLMVFVVLCSLTAAAPMARAGGAPFPSELVWGNDALYRILGTKIPVPGAPASQEPFYIIGAVDPSHPQATYGNLGLWDHTIPIPAGNAGGFTAIWHIYWLELGPNANLGVNVEARFATTPFGLTAGQTAEFVYAADLSGNGTLVPLTSLEKVDEAIALGLATSVESGIVFTCPVVPAGTSP